MSRPNVPFGKPDGGLRRVRPKQRAILPQIPTPTTTTMLTHKPIADVYRKDGFTFTLLHRTDRMALYEQADESGLVAYEVCRIQRHDGRTIGGNALPAAEFLPSTQQWGTTAWTFPTLTKALVRLHAQQQHLQETAHA